jgi:ribosomal protein L22
MIVKARQNNLHLSSRKLGLVCDLVRFKTVDASLKILANLPDKGAKNLLKLLKQAIANATNNFTLDANKLYVLNCLANQAKTVKRTMPKARGSASLLRKRHSDLVLLLSDNINDKKNPNLSYNTNMVNLNKKNSLQQVTKPIIQHSVKESIDKESTKKEQKV